MYLLLIVQQTTLFVRYFLNYSAKYRRIIINQYVTCIIWRMFIKHQQTLENSYSSQMCRRSSILAKATNIVPPRLPKRRRRVKNISPTRPSNYPTCPKYFADASKDFAEASRHFTANVVKLPTRPVTVGHTIVNDGSWTIV